MDREILELLECGRETTGSLADGVDTSPQAIRNRMQWLREWGYVDYYHEPTALHELVPAEERDGVDDGREE
jgi:predicted ArsR family transcriptional regulator